MKQSPLFVTDEFTINMDLVSMTRWDDKMVPELMIFFTQGAHISLDQEDGKDFLEIYVRYHEPSEI